MFRRGIIAGAFAVPATAQDRPVRLIVPYPPGGLGDMLGRRLARRMQTPLGRAVVVQNVVGAGGATGTLEVARARPDGRTLLLASASNLAIQPMMAGAAAFDPLTDLTAVSLLGAATVVVAVRPEVAVDLVGLIAAARARPGQLRCGTSEWGSYLHLVAELLTQAVGGLEFHHSHYPTDGPSLVALLGGEVDVVTDTLAAALEHHRAGRLRILAVAGKRRSPLLADVPTVAEALSMPGFEAALWMAAMLPPGASDPLRNRMAYAINSILADGSLRTDLERSGIEVGGLLSPLAIGPFIRAEQDRWRPFVQAIGDRRS